MYTYSQKRVIVVSVQPHIPTLASRGLWQRDAITNMYLLGLSKPTINMYMSYMYHHQKKTGVVYK